MVSSLDDLYKEILIDHYRYPRNRGAIEAPDVATRGHNPLCGDTLELSLVLEGDRIADVMTQGQGCSISQASASMMTERVKGRSLAEVREAVGLFKGMMLEDRKLAEEEYDSLGDLESLEGVKNYPVRIKCALLAWNTLLEALEIKAASDRQGVTK
ncbi:MAG TPA: SUF system NifU family Fe-S cluster assembly protein [Chloroflexota bacterium]|nr:SUF system NifU family Fe-S cluster assembly protein [Chloroflexota bacterium]